jgi:predicted membrane protein
MELQEPDSEKEKDKIREDVYKRWDGDHERGKIFGGLIIICIGGILFAREMGIYFPRWIFSWPMILIVIGIFTGVKHAFKNMSWMILVLIGSLFLVRENMPEFNFTNYIWPVVIMLIGLFVILKPRHNNWHRHMRNNMRYKMRQERRNGRRDWNNSGLRDEHNRDSYYSTAQDEYLDCTAVFGSIKKNIITKDFKGGEINAVFGGAEINLMQADINGSVVLEINQVFAGTKLIVPPHWEIKSELAAVLGSVEDKRPIQRDITVDGSKVLVLKGTTVFGGIDIKSY